MSPRISETAELKCECGCGHRPKPGNRFLKNHHARKHYPGFKVNGNGCWEWQGAQDHGYGKMKRDQILWWSHRYFYTKIRGPIPPGLHLHHKCENKICVNPDHLEPMSPSENGNLHGDPRVGERVGS